jgi:hypothetical protein
MGQRVVTVPVLGRRTHAHPRQGGCLVEIAGTLPGGRWTDRPPSVAPVLAALAREVNDRVSDGHRRDLLPLAPWLIGQAEVGAEDTGDAVARALARHVPRQRGDATAGRAARHARRLVRLAVEATGGDDRLLVALLVDAINAGRAVRELPAVALPAAWRRPTELPVRVDERAPDGPEFPYLTCVAVLADWPAELREAWLVRAAELYDVRTRVGPGTYSG